MSEWKVVVPGEEIGTTEEFIAGKGTYEHKGRIFSTYLGELKPDQKEMTVNVDPLNPPVNLKVGDIVLAHVTDVRRSMVLSDVLRVEDNPRGITGGTMGSIHISKISQDYTDDVRNEFRIGDIIRARVIQVDPSLQLSTDKPNLGALVALCTKCRMRLIKTSKGLKCDNCQRVEQRRTAPDFGRYTIEKNH